MLIVKYNYYNLNYINTLGFWFCILFLLICIYTFIQKKEKGNTYA